MVNSTALLRLYATLACVVLSIFIASGNVAAQFPNPGVTQPQISPRPDWVALMEIPAPREERTSEVQQGVYQLLYNVQAQVENDHYVQYVHSAQKITSRTGLETASRLQFLFDPSRDKISIHSIQVIRDGVALDKLDPSTFVVARQEADMANGVTNGDLTIYIEVKDVRVGDIVVYEASWETRSPLWPGHYANSFSTSWSVPVERYSYRVLVNNGALLKVRNVGETIAPIIRDTESGVEYLWEATDPEPIAGEPYVPQTHFTWGEVSISTFDSWRTVANSLADEYETRTMLPANFLNEQEWLTSDDTQAEKITAAIRYVQDNIRYVADEIGVGAYLPRRPAEVLERGWGDCKDKSIFLVALLREIGVEAYVALTDLDRGYAIEQMAPSPNAFDHAIVVFTVDSRRYWIDPTNYHQGGVFPDMAPPVYGYGLPVKKGPVFLWKMADKEVHQPQKTFRELYDFSDFEKSGIAINIRTEFLGREADFIRRSIENQSDTQLAKEYLDYYQRIYPGLQSIEEIRIEDDRDANRVSISEKYHLGREHYEGEDIETAFPMRADAVLNAFGQVNITDRKAPISLPFPFWNKHVVTIRNGGGGEGGLTDLEQSNEFFNYQRKEVVNGYNIEITYELSTRDIAVPAKEIAAYKTVTDDLETYGVLEYNYDATPEYSLFEVSAAASLLLLTIGLVYLPFGIFNAFKDATATIDDTVFYPVSVWKFSILNIATLGVYGVFWMWRCWRWVKHAEDRQIMPFWRTFFAVIWFLPLYNSIRDHHDEPQPPMFVGVLLWIGYIASHIVGRVLSRANAGDEISLSLGIVVDAFHYIFYLPLLFHVNNLNADNSNVKMAHSKWSVCTVMLLVLGIGLWGLILIGLTAPAELLAQ